jgi:hypothetical protein
MRLEVIVTCYEATWTGLNVIATHWGKGQRDGMESHWDGVRSHINMLGCDMGGHGGHSNTLRHHSNVLEAIITCMETIRMRFTLELW